MATVLEHLQDLQRRVAERNEGEEAWADEAEKVYFADIHGLFHVEFYVSPFNEAFEDCLKTLAQPGVAASLRSLAFRGPDEGANGTRNWDFTALTSTTVEFPKLKSFYVEPTEITHHNHSLIAQDYDDDGMTAALVTKMPGLQSLTLPSAPDASFFSIGSRPLITLRVDCGYDHQSFIRNLSASLSFPALRLLDFGDFNETYVDGYEQMKTPFEDYEAVITSRAFSNVRRFNLRNPGLNEDQLQRLVDLKAGLSLSVFRIENRYVRQSSVSEA